MSTLSIVYYFLMDVIVGFVYLMLCRQTSTMARHVQSTLATTLLFNDDAGLSKRQLGV